MTWGLCITAFVHKIGFSTILLGWQVIHSRAVCMRRVRKVVDLVHPRLGCLVDELMHLVCRLWLHRQVVHCSSAVPGVLDIDGNESPCLKLRAVLVETVFADVHLGEYGRSRRERHAALPCERREVGVEPLGFDAQLWDTGKHLRREPVTAREDVVEHEDVLLGLHDLLARHVPTPSRYVGRALQSSVLPCSCGQSME